MSQASLNNEPTFAEPDEIYAAILAAHDGLNDTDSRRLNARLVLLLSNHIGNADVVQAALDAARESL